MIWAVQANLPKNDVAFGLSTLIYCPREPLFEDGPNGEPRGD